MTNVLQLDLFGGSKIVHKPARQQKPRSTVARILHLGAGVQSSALAEMIVVGELPRVDFVLFADTGNEPKRVYKQVEYLKTRLENVGMPLVTVKREGLGLYESIMYGDGRFITMPLYTRQPDGKIAIVRRQCTYDYKIVPSDNYTLNWLIEQGHAFYSKPTFKSLEAFAGHTLASALMGEPTTRRIVKQGVLVENLYGISYEEFYRAGRRGPQWQKALYPLIDRRMKRADCVAWLESHGLPVPGKSSCKVCPFHEDEYWLEMSLNEPDDFEEVCVFDDFIRTPQGKRRFKGSMRGEFYVHRSCQSLRSIDLAALVAAKTASPLFDSPLCGNHCRL